MRSMILFLVHIIRRNGDHEIKLKCQNECGMILELVGGAVGCGGAFGGEVGCGGAAFGGLAASEKSSSGWIKMPRVDLCDPSKKGDEAAFIALFASAVSFPHDNEPNDADDGYMEFDAVKNVRKQNFNPELSNQSQFILNNLRHKRMKKATQSQLELDNSAWSTALSGIQSHLRKKSPLSSKGLKKALEDEER